MELENSLVARKDQSVRQLGGVIWTLSQSYDRAQSKGEELLLELRLTVPNTIKLIFNKGDWRYDFQKKLEDQLRESLQRQIGNSLELLEGDLRTVWQQLHDALHRNFSEQSRGAATLPDFLKQRDELLRKIELTLLERGTSQQVEQQMGKLFEDAANWLRIPAGVAAAGGVATVIAIVVHSLAVVDFTGIVAGTGVVAGGGDRLSWKAQADPRRISQADGGRSGMPPSAVWTIICAIPSTAFIRNSRPPLLRSRVFARRNACSMSRCSCVCASWKMASRSKRPKLSNVARKGAEKGNHG